MARFHFLHVSDLHLASVDRRSDIATAAKHLRLPQLLQGQGLGWLSSHAPSPLRCAAEFAYARKTTLDAVLITGDLATSGYRRDDLVMAKTLLTPAVAAGYFAWHPFSGGTMPTFNFGVPLLWMPGNHDRYSNWTFGVGGTDFDQVVGWPANAFVWPHAAPGLRILRIDCALRPGSGSDIVPHRLGVGEVHDVLLDEVRRESALRQPGELLLWMVHWPPEHLPQDSMMQLVRERDLLDLAQEVGVDLILSGHTHHASVYDSSVGVPVICCGTTSQALGKEPHTLFDIFVDLDADELVIDVDRWEFHSTSDEEAFERAPGWRVTRSAKDGLRIYDES
jgi:hypothetical protein